MPLQCLSRLSTIVNAFFRLVTFPKRSRIMSICNGKGIVLFGMLLASTWLGGLAVSKPDAVEDADLKLLKNARVPADETGLLEFFTKRTTSEDQSHAIAELIKQLGNNS